MNHIIVLFEVTVGLDCMSHYLEMAETLKEDLFKAEGLISSERYSSLVTKGKSLSLSVWKNEASIMKWRNLMAHRLCQIQGRSKGFINYQITVVTLLRTYTMNNRNEAPIDSQQYFKMSEVG